MKNWQQISAGKPWAAPFRSLLTAMKRLPGSSSPIAEGHNVIGVLTDRDIAIALGTRAQRASEVHVSHVVPQKLFSCTADDDVHTALRTIREEGIRLLLVIDRAGALIGVLSIDDVILTARVEVQWKEVSYEDVKNTYREILLPFVLSKHRERTAA